MRSLIISIFFCCSTFLFSNEIPSVLIIGNGFMGNNHLKNLETLQKEGLVTVAGLVDIDPTRLKNVNYPVFETAEEACKKLSPDIVVIATNTKTHFEVIQTVLKTCKEKQCPALFIEKPLVETSDQARELIQILEKEGYPTEHPLICGYLFRFSPIVDRAIRAIKDGDLKIQDIQVRWQKKRAPTRPSAGVHIDEATHPIDLILNYLLPELGISGDPIDIHCLSRKWDGSIIDQKQQQQLYPDQPEMQTPLAEVEFEINTESMRIHSFSSFMQPPQIREVVLNCSDETTITLSYDRDQKDQLTIASKKLPPQVIVIDKPNKLLDEWRLFLECYQTGNSSTKIPTLQDMLEDIEITEKLVTN